LAAIVEVEEFRASRMNDRLKAATPGAYFFTRVYATPGTSTGDAASVPRELSTGARSILGEEVQYTLPGTPERPFVV
jgi:hypothetical protein